MEEIIIRNIDDFLNSHLGRIVDKRGVLLLGPQFGRTNTGQTAGEYIREKLASQDWLDKLDEDFDNLFMLKSPNVFFEYELKSQLARHYRAMLPGNELTKIANLPFRAIISCTPDLMLKKAFESQKLPYDFHYFGQKQPTIREDRTILYNLFGTAENEESLIVTYEDFYKFFVRLLGGDQQMPLALQYILQEAEFFMLLGFNLEKWYIPLIIRKLNEQKNLQEKTRFSVLTNDSQFKPETRFKLSTTFVVLNGDIQDILDSLEKAVSDFVPPPGEDSSQAKPDPVQQRGMLDSINEFIGSDNLENAIQALLSCAPLLLLNPSDENDLRNLDAQLASAQKAFGTSQITFQELSGARRRVGATLLDMTARVRKNLHLDEQGYTSP